MKLNLLLNERFILSLIIINSIIIFLSGFDAVIDSYPWIFFVDNIITSIFLLEVIYKIKEWGFKKYFDSNWNRFDFILVIFATPSLVAWSFGIDFFDVDYLLAFRILRAFKFFRFVKFIPNIDHIINGLGRASKASLLIIIAFFILNFTVSVVSCFIFKNAAPEYFGNPLISFYSIFKIFTVEGWYEIPDVISESYGKTSVFFIRLYFIVILFFGGIFGLSLVNSIFVDAMVSDNNEELEGKISELEIKIDQLIKLINQGNSQKPK